MTESLRGKVQIDRETHAVTCPKCRHRFRISVRVYQAVERVIVNKAVSAITNALGKTSLAKKAERAVRKALA